MVEFDDTIGKKIDELTDSLSSLTKTIAGIDFSNFKRAAKGVADSAANAGEKAKKASEDILKFVGSMGGSPLEGVIRGFGNLSGKLLSVGRAAGTVASQGIADLHDPTKKATDLAQHLGTSFKRLSALMDNIAKTQNIAREAFIVTGHSIKDANIEAKKYAQTMREAALETGFSKEELAAMDKVVGRWFPESITKTTKVLTQFGISAKRNVREFDVAALALRNFGVEGKQAADETAKRLQEFNQTPVQTAQKLVTMHNAATNVGERLHVARDQILRASSSLGIFGQKSDAAAAVWQTFTGRLKASGVPIKNIGEIVDSVTKQIAGMSMQHRAFISMVSGMGAGRGALGGALKLELAMRSPRGMEQNLMALTKTLGQFGGGRVITLEQAANNPQLEQQFALQRQMLGKLTGITTQEQQNRILETLQGVQTGGISQVEGSKTLGDIYKSGRNLQQESVSIQTRLLRAAQVHYGNMDHKFNVLIETLTGQTTAGKTSGKVGRSPIEQLMEAMSTRGLTRRNQVHSALRKLGSNFKTAVGVLTAKKTLQGSSMEGPRPDLARRGVEWSDIARKSLHESERLRDRKTTTVAEQERLRAVRRIVPGVATREPLRATRRGGTGAVISVLTSNLRASRRASTVGLKTVSDSINRSNDVLHRDLRQLISVTRDGLSAIKPTGVAGEAVGAGGTPGTGTDHTITVKLVGDVPKATLDDFTTKIANFLTNSQLNTPE